MRGASQGEHQVYEVLPTLLMNMTSLISMVIKDVGM